MWRKLRGLNQEELAVKLKVHSSTIRNYERGRTTPDLATVDEVGKILDVDPRRDLLGESPPKVAALEGGAGAIGLRLQDESGYADFPLIAKSAISSGVRIARYAEVAA